MEPRLCCTPSRAAPHQVARVLVPYRLLVDVCLGHLVGEAVPPRQLIHDGWWAQQKGGTRGSGTIAQGTPRARDGGHSGLRPGVHPLTSPRCGAGAQDDAGVAAQCGRHQPLIHSWLARCCRCRTAACCRRRHWPPVRRGCCCRIRCAGSRLGSAMGLQGGAAELLPRRKALVARGGQWTASQTGAHAHKAAASRSEEAMGCLLTCRGSHWVPGSSGSQVGGSAHP